MTARILTVTETEYHSDPCATPSLSHSVAHTLVTQSPRHAWLEHPRLGGNKERASTKAMDEGSILHRLLLDAGSDFDVLAVDDFRGKDARAERDDSLARGRIPIKVRDFERLHEAALRLKQNARGQGFPLGLPGSRSELAIEFTEKAGDVDVLWGRTASSAARSRDSPTSARTARSWPTSHLRCRARPGGRATA
jgi:hypothetical protein